MDTLEPWVADPLLTTALSELTCEQLLGSLLDPAEPSRVLARELLTRVGGLKRMARMAPRELQRTSPQTSPEKALQLACAFELGRRSLREPLPVARPILAAADLVPHLQGLLTGFAKEVFLVVLLDAKNRPMRTERVSEGCLTWSVVHPREVFSPAVREGAGAIVVAHNHPSGDPRPSRQDLAVTERLVRVGETLGIPLLDHVVLGHDSFVSLRAEGHLSGSKTWT
ncbi:MAG: DNA repair protein RadC [Pseudohongiellaceae bacterium]|jgi:DNA repair protein RadC